MDLVQIPDAYQPPQDYSGHGRRLRRAVRVDAMRTTLAALERAVPVMLTLDAKAISLDDEDEMWDEFLDDEAVRVRRLMKRSIQLTEETKRLQSTQQHLRRLLWEHGLASRVLAGLVQEQENQPAREWARDVRRWSQLTRQHFKPWTVEQCEAEMQAALKSINGFQWSEGKQTTGVSFLGWRDQRRVDHARGAFQFEFQKTFHGYNVEDSLKVIWDMFTDRTTYYKINVGPQLEVVDDIAVGHLGCAHHEVVQWINPDTVVIRLTRRYTALDVDVHIVYLGCRLKTESGYIQCMRAIYCPELVKAFSSPRDVWASNFMWSKWELLEGTDYKLSIGGSVASKNIQYAEQWMLGILGLIFRGDRLVTGQGLITSE